MNKNSLLWTKNLWLKYSRAGFKIIQEWSKQKSPKIPNLKTDNYSHIYMLRYFYDKITIFTKKSFDWLHWCWWYWSKFLDIGDRNHFVGDIFEVVVPGAYTVRSRPKSFNSYPTVRNQSWNFLMKKFPTVEKLLKY